MVNAPLSDIFMLPVPEASNPAVEICSDRSAAGMIFFSLRDAVIGQKYHPQLSMDLRFTVGFCGHGIDQLDDQFSLMIGRGGLAGKR